jgi:hypothetical protein
VLLDIAHAIPDHNLSARHLFAPNPTAIDFQGNSI